ncbi:MAG: cytochrome P450 [Myxococcota bacterium]|nr:cytochrome P450 [Myxococcota bacterium]
MPSPSEFEIDDLSVELDQEVAALAALRDRDPIHWDAGHGFWLVTRHADVKHVSRHPEIFSSEPRGPWHAFESRFSMQAQDGPAHHRTRNVVSRGFTPRALDGLEQRALRYTDEAIDAVAARGRCDLVEDIALPVPMRIIADMLGIGSQFELFRRWVDAVTGSMAHDATLQTRDDEIAAKEFESYVRSAVADREERPRDDLISIMLRGRQAGVLDSFSRDPFPGVPDGDGVLGFISFLVLAGSETTRHAISQGMRALIAHPEQRARLAANPELLGLASDEILRWTTPVRAMQRTVMHDVELGGKQLEQGSTVVLLYLSANRDPAVFDEPELFRIDRRPNDHISFGFGSHFCLGSNLARMEIRVVIGRLLERLPDLQLAPGSQPTRFASSIVNGLTKLPAVFAPTP